MHHRFYILLTISVVGFFAACGNSNSGLSVDKIENGATADNPKPENNGPKGTPVFSDTVYNFKKVTSGMQVQHRYKFKNMGKGDLLIRNCQAACGCTTPGWTKDVIKPGEEGYVDATFNSTGRGAKEGLENEKTITVEFENSTVETIVLKFKATVFSTPEEEAEYNQNNH
jgi:hypothetical protein